MITLSSDNVIYLNALTNQTTNAVINTATVTGTLNNSTDDSILYSFTLTSTGSGGNYSGALPVTITSTLGQQLYIVKITAVSTQGTLYIESNQLGEFAEG
jgi:hypothetical protein